MNFDYTPKMQEYREKVSAFMDKHIYPNEQRFHDEVSTGDRWEPTKIVEELKPLARAEKLWNLFLPDSPHGAGLTNLEYAPLAEIMGRVEWASEIFNCSAPDTGNMETIERYGTDAQKQQWLTPLLEGKIRSCFAMTEPRRRLLRRHQHRKAPSSVTATNTF
ncbi:MAG: acyl-CoA dehydrogenase family protein [Rhodospirillales bacterium]